MDFRNRISLYRMKNAMVLANLVSNAVGVGVVLFLSQGAPEQVESLSRHVSMVFIPLAFLVPLIATFLYEGPIRSYWDAVYRNRPISEEKISRSHRRLLNEPYFLIVVDIGVWLIAAGVYSTLFWLYDVDRQFVQQALSLNLITGLITTTVAFFVFEFVLRRRVIPHAFPNGGLYLIPGTHRIRIRARLTALFFACNLIPLIALLHLVLWVPENPGEAYERLQISVATQALVFIGVGIWLTFLVSSNLTRPLHDIIRVLGQVRRGIFDQRVTVTTNDEIGYTGEMINEMTRGLQERDFIKETFGKYVSAEIRDEILGGRIPFDGEARRVTVLFADLRDFTPMVEKTDPKEVIRILNGYFKEMEEAIRGHHGLVVQYIGDEIEAAFGAPVFREDHAASAVSAAVEMSRRLKAFNEASKGRGFQLAHGIGIHTGEVVAANIGSPDRLSYTMIGDTVNLASRVQELNKDFGTEILITEATRAELGKAFDLRRLPPARVKGMEQDIQIYAMK
jgi:adenylate cyclase